MSFILFHISHLTPGLRKHRRIDICITESIQSTREEPVTLNYECFINWGDANIQCICNRIVWNVKGVHHLLDFLFIGHIEEVTTVAAAVPDGILEYKYPPL